MHKKSFVAFASSCIAAFILCSAAMSIASTKFERYAAAASCAVTFNSDGTEGSPFICPWVSRDDFETTDVADVQVTFFNAASDGAANVQICTNFDDAEGGTCGSNNACPSSAGVHTVSIADPSNSNLGIWANNEASYCSILVTITSLDTEFNGYKVTN